MKKIISQVIFILILVTVSFGQSEKPILFDEFGDVQIGQLLIRLDVSAAAVLRQPKETIGLFQIYGGSKHNYYAYPYRKRAIYYDYLVNSRQVDAKKFKFQNCGFSEKEILTRFFLVSKNSNVPECNESVVVPSKTTQFSTRHYENPHYYFDNPYPSFDVKISKVENEFLNKLLSKSPDSKVVLVGYLGSNVYSDFESDRSIDNDYPKIRKPDDPKLIQKILEEQKDALMKIGIPFSKILTINGGYVDATRRVEIWFVPKGKEVPKPKPDYFPTKTNI